MTRIISAPPSSGSVDLTAPGPIGSATPGTGAFTELDVAQFAPPPSGLIGVSSFASPGGLVSGITGGVIDRFAYLNLRGGINSNVGITTPERAFDANGNSFASIAAGTNGVFSLSPRQPYNTYSAGKLVIISLFTDDITVRILRGSISTPSFQVLDPPTVTVGATGQTMSVWDVPATTFHHETEITITASAGSAGRAYLISYFPVRPDDDEKQQYLPLGDSDAIDVYTPRFKVNSNSETGELQPRGVEIYDATGNGNRFRVEVSGGVLQATAI